MLCVMADMSVSAARSRLADVINDARVHHAPVFLTRRGRRVAAVIGAEDLERLTQAAEERISKRPTPPAQRSPSTAPSPGTRSRRTSDSHDPPDRVHPCCHASGVSWMGQDVVGPSRPGRHIEPAIGVRGVSELRCFRPLWRPRIPAGRRMGGEFGDGCYRPSR